MKKLLSLVLALAIIVCAVPMGAFSLTASAAMGTRGDFVYEYSETDDVATIIDYTGTGGDVVIPEVLPFGWFDLYVTSIDSYTFYDCTNLTSITIPDSVTSIGNRAFYHNSLTKITVDENNANYCSQDGVLFNKDKTTLVQYPAGKTDTSYTIPNNEASGLRKAAIYKGFRGMLN